MKPQDGIIGVKINLKMDESRIYEVDHSPEGKSEGWGDKKHQKEYLVLWM